MTESGITARWIADMTAALFHQYEGVDLDVITSALAADGAEAIAEGAWSNSKSGSREWRKVVDRLAAMDAKEIASAQTPDGLTESEMAAAKLAVDAARAACDSDYEPTSEAVAFIVASFDPSNEPETTPTMH